MLRKRFFKTIDEVEVTFELDRPGVESAALVAETNDWEPQPMKRANRGRGPFRLKVRLPKGQPVQFRYLLNESVWDDDEAADAYWPNEVGSDNGVVFTS